MGKQVQPLQSDVVVELTQEDLSAVDDDYVSKYIPTVAPATPQILATPSLDFNDIIHSSVRTEVVLPKQNEGDSFIIKTDENNGNTNDQEDSGESNKSSLLEIERNNSGLSQKYCLCFIILSDPFYEQGLLRTLLLWKVIFFIYLFIYLFIYAFMHLFMYLFIYFHVFYESLFPKQLECLQVQLTNYADKQKTSFAVSE